MKNELHDYCTTSKRKYSNGPTQTPGLSVATATFSSACIYNILTFVCLKKKKNIFLRFNVMSTWPFSIEENNKFH